MDGLTDNMLTQEEASRDKGLILSDIQALRNVVSFKGASRLIIFGLASC